MYVGLLFSALNLMLQVFSLLIWLLPSLVRHRSQKDSTIATFRGRKHEQTLQNTFSCSISSIQFYPEYHCYLCITIGYLGVSWQYRIIGNTNNCNLKRCILCRLLTYNLPSNSA